MKKVLIFIMISMMCYLLSASWVELDDSGNDDLYSCSQQGRSAAGVEFNLDGFEMESKTVNGETYSLISYPESGDLLEVGMPDLPVFSKALIIPDEGTPVLNVISFEKTVYENIMVYPEEAIGHDGEANQDRFVKNEEFYSSSELYPAEIAWLGEPAVMRGLRLVPVTFSPFQYDAANRSLTVYSNIEIEVTTSGNGGVNCVNSTRDNKLSRAFDGFYKSNTLNFDQVQLRDEYQDPTILFICNDDDDVLDALQYLIDWKKQKGYNVHVATTTETGTTNTSIKNYIQDAYDNWADPPEYVNLIGDASGSFTIPTWYSSSSYGEGDHPYAQLEGNDVLGDVIMGRLTFSTITTLQVQIIKTIGYEKEPWTGDTDWYSRAVLTGDPSHSGYSTITVNKTVKELMLDHPGNFWGDDNFIEIYEPNFATQINAAINLGVSYYSYRGYLGTSGWNPGSTSNGWMLPFCVIPTCGSNNWGSGTGKAEQLVQMGTLSIPSGGIGAMGTTTSGTHTPFNNAIAHGVWGGIFRDHIWQQGGAVLQGKYYLWLTFPQNPSNYVDTFSHWNTLMGEASVELWTRVPQQMTADYDEVIPEGANYYQVAVWDSIGNPAEDAWVCLTSEDMEFKVTGHCNASGVVILDLDGAETGEYNLVVTKHDHIPIVETVDLEQVDYYVDISEVSYDDATGNNDGVVNPGETIEIIPTMLNTGTAGLTGVSAIIECLNDDVNIITDEVSFGDISSGSSSTPAAGFEFELAASAQGGTELQMILDITDNDGNEWTTWLMIPVTGASLYASEYHIGGDGIIDPGETEDIYFTIENNGDLSAADVQGLLMCNNRRITISDSLGSFGTITAGNSGNNSTNRFTITASSAILPGTHIPFIINLNNADGYDSNVTINVPIGEPDVTDPFGPDEYGYWCYDDGDTSYDKCPEYEWIEIDPAYDGDGTAVNWSNTTGTGLGGGYGDYDNVEFPEGFTFVFYGIEYDELCISSNGWIAPGHHETGNFMNYQIPGPQGPSPMIAAFWDDLSVSNSNVLWYYDDDAHYYVVSWSHITNGDTGVSETFQIILYDQIFYPTTTGDSEIKIQYQDVTNNNAGQYPSNHGQYATVGLENEDSSIGLQYTFNNAYPDACKSLQDEMAILFTPPPIPPDGPFININNFYAFAGDDYFIESGETALISLVLENMGAAAANNVDVEIAINDEYVTMIDNLGSCDQVAPNDLTVLEGQFEIEMSENVPDFHLFYVEVIIASDEDSWNWTLPFYAYHPNTFAVDQDSVYMELLPGTTDSHVFTLSNIGDLPVNFYVRTDETTPMQRDITGSTITCDTESFTPGEEATWTFTVTNAAPDNEWISDVWLDFPLGVTVLDASDVIGGSGGPMVWDGTTGAGQRVNWHGLTTNGWGVLHDSEIATWEVDVLLSTEFAGDLSFGWEIGGDGYGVEPHNVTGEIFMLYPLRWINLDTSSGNIPAGETQEITMNFDTNDIEEGVYSCEIVITCDSWDTKTINVVLSSFEQDDQPDSVPQSVVLGNNYPNPFNPETEIFFQIPQQQDVTLSVYNLKGQLVKTLISDNLAAGNHSISWQGKDSAGNSVGSGVYFYNLKAGDISQTHKMILLK